MQINIKRLIKAITAQAQKLTFRAVLPAAKGTIIRRELRNRRET